MAFLIVTHAEGRWRKENALRVNTRTAPVETKTKSCKVCMCRVSSNPNLTRDWLRRRVQGKKRLGSLKRKVETVDRGRDRCSDFLPGAVPLSAPQRGWKGSTETHTAAAHQQSQPELCCLTRYFRCPPPEQGRAGGQERGRSRPPPQKARGAAHSVVPLPVSSLQSSHSSSNTPQGIPAWSLGG